MPVSIFLQCVDAFLFGMQRCNLLLLCGQLASKTSILNIQLNVAFPALDIPPFQIKKLFRDLA
jgi:hypothetical protein